MRRAATNHQLGMHGVMTNVYPLPGADLSTLTSCNRFLHWLAISCSTILARCFADLSHTKNPQLTLAYEHPEFFVSQ